MLPVQTTQVNPLDRSDEIKALFLADDHHEFQEFFDRAYPSAVGSGGKSWIGVDSDGTLVTHIAQFRRRFVLGDRVVAGGILLNLIAAKSHRTLLPALSLLRQMVSDAKADRDPDFLYANPNAAATALLKAAGFSVVAALGRFVLPLAGQRWYSDLSVRLYRTMLRVRAGKDHARAVRHEARGFDIGVLAAQPSQSAALRPIPAAELYRQCLTGYPGNADHWFTFHRGDRASSMCAAVLVRGDAAGVATWFALYREPSISIAALVPGLAAELRRNGYSRLSVSTVKETRFAGELSQAGFVPREDSTPLVAYAVTEAGTLALQTISGWEITALDCDPYFP